MRRLSKVVNSRAHWKDESTRRGAEIRYLKKELNRVKSERDNAKKKAKEAEELLRQRNTRDLQPVVQDKGDLVFLTIQLFLVAHIGFRAISRVFEVFADLLGIKKIPCPQTVINWVTRLSLVRIQSAAMMQGSPLSMAPFCNGLILMIDTSIALGTGKILTILALDASHYQFMEAAPGFQDVRCIAVSVASSWTGEMIAEFLKRIINVMGRPAAYLKDGGSDLQKAIRLLGEQNLASPVIDDISHKVANLLKQQYQTHPLFQVFLSACGRVSSKLKQTILACLAPPKVQTKARFMNLHRLVIWADRLLKLSPPGGAKKDSVLSKLRACLDLLPTCKRFIKRFRDDALPLLTCQQILKTQGLSHDTLVQCQPLIESIPTATVRNGFIAYLQRQLETATILGLDKVGLPICSDQIESLFGLAKQLGVGEIKDAGRIAIRIPAMCGTPTREEAEQVLEISVAEQKEITNQVSSVIKQRRDVLQNPDRLESLSAEQSPVNIELIPSSKNRSKYQETIYISSCYKNRCGPANEPSERPPRSEVLVL
jgi:hypothetical protein